MLHTGGGTTRIAHSPARLAHLHLNRVEKSVENHQVTSQSEILFVST